MTERDKKVPALWLEQAALGELNDASRVALEQRLGADAIEAERQQLLHSNAQILQALPPTRMAQTIRQRAARARKQQQTRSWLPGAWTLAPVVSLAALLIIVLSMDAGGPLAGVQPDAAQGVETTRIKGLAPHLVVYRRQGEGVERLRDGAKVRAGDELQVAYVAAQQKHGVVVSIDGAGAVTLHMAPAMRSAALNGARETLLGESYRLDAAPAFERFVFVTSEQPFDVAVVEQAARVVAAAGESARTQALRLPSGLRQVSFTVIKVQP